MDDSRIHHRDQLLDCLSAGLPKRRQPGEAAGRSPLRCGGAQSARGREHILQKRDLPDPHRDSGRGYYGVTTHLGSRMAAVSW